MKKLFSCLIALLCILGLSMPAMADVLPRFDFGASVVLIVILLGIAAIAAAVIIKIIRQNKK